MLLSRYPTATPIQYSHTLILYLVTASIYARAGRFILHQNESVWTGKLE